MTTSLIGGFGIVGAGVAGDRAPRRTRPDLCAQHGHPGATYNPWCDRTWCLCCEVIRDGDHFEHVACCDGPLVEYLESDGEYRARTTTGQLDLFAGSEATRKCTGSTPATAASPTTPPAASAPLSPPP